MLYFLNILGGFGNDIYLLIVIGILIIFLLCFGGCKLVSKFIVVLLAVIFVIFGLSKIDRSMIRREYVIEKKVWIY